MFSKNFCSPKLRVHQHFDFTSSYEMRYEVEAMPFLTISKFRSFPKNSALLNRKCNKTDLPLTFISENMHCVPHVYSMFSFKH